MGKTTLLYLSISEAFIPKSRSGGGPGGGGGGGGDGGRGGGGAEIDGAESADAVNVG